MIAYTQMEQTGSDMPTQEEMVTIMTTNVTETTTPDIEKQAEASNSSSSNEIIEMSGVKQVVCEPKRCNDGSFLCYSDKLKLHYKVHVQNDGKTAPQRCYILTVHDLGFDYNEFQDLIMTPEMAGLCSRIVWLHVNLPGQSVGDADLSLKTYPSVEELGAELATVLDFFKVPQAVVIGDGAGANVAVNFAQKCSNRCLGLVLIEPIASPASFIEIMKHKMQHLNSNFFANGGSKNSHLNAHEKANMILSHVKRVNSHEHLSGSFNVAEQEQHVYDNRNIKNLSLFAEAFINRPSLVEHLETLSMDVLTVAGKQSSAYNETKKFYSALQESRRRNPISLVNCPMLEVDGLVKMSPCKLAVSLQYFLQGIGLVSAMPLRRLSTRQSSFASGSESETTGSLSSAKQSLVPPSSITPPAETVAETSTVVAATELQEKTTEVEEDKPSTEAAAAGSEEVSNSAEPSTTLVEQMPRAEKAKSISSQCESNSPVVSSNPSLNDA